MIYTVDSNGVTVEVTGSGREAQEAFYRTHGDARILIADGIVTYRRSRGEVITEVHIEPWTPRILLVQRIARPYHNPVIPHDMGVALKWQLNHNKK